MARHSKTVLGLHGRDKGKAFTLTEMDAFSCEEWGRNAVSSIYRYATSSDNGVLNFMAEGIREAFSEPVVPEIELPSDGSMTADDPVIVSAREEAKQEAQAKKQEELTNSPTQTAALIGLRFFFQLPASEQSKTLRPLLACYEFELFGQTCKVMEDVGGVLQITKAARGYIEEAQTVAFLEAEAFRMHTDFFTPAVRSICDRLALAASLNGQQRKTSPAQ